MSLLKSLEKKLRDVAEKEVMKRVTPILDEIKVTNRKLENVVKVLEDIKDLLNETNEKLDRVVKRA